MVKYICQHVYTDRKWVETCHLLSDLGSKRPHSHLAHLQTGSEVVGTLAVLDCLNEEINKPLQRVLIHGLYVEQIRNAEKQQLRTERHRLVALADL